VIVELVTTGLIKTASAQYGEDIGKLINKAHGIGGRVYAVSDDVLFIQSFEYDGTGPDAFFWVGNSTVPSPSGVIVPYPVEYSGREPPVLGRFDGQDILLKLPRGVRVRDLRWLSVWCRRFAVDFGSLVFPTNLNIPKPRVLPEIQRLAHGVRSGNVTILDAKTFYIPNLHYDGSAPDAFFYVGNGPEPNPQGIKIPNELGDLKPLHGYQGEDIEIRLPGDMTVQDIDWLAIWCVSFRENFGHVLIPKDLNGVPPALGQNKPPTTESGTETGIHSTRDYDSCIPLLNERMQVQWKAIVSGVIIRLSGKMDENEYMAFGISGAEGRTQMVGGDVAVTYFDKETGKFHAKDYVLSAKSQCDGSRGACPDDRVGGQNNIIFISGDRRDGVTTVVYQRSLPAQESNLDKEIPSVGRVNVIAAIGPLNSVKEVNYHSIRTGPQEDHRIDFSSHGVNQCRTLLFPIDQEPDSDKANAEKSDTTTENPYKPWQPAVIRDENVFRAQIGPTGNKKGYSVITGHVSWGIAWYINGLLIPEIHVERGQTYTFIIEGGNNPVNSARYHPLYITDSSEGGFGQQTEEQQRKEKLYAGVEYDNSNLPYASAAGPLCEWKHKTTDKWDVSDTFEEYKATLTLECENIGQPFNLTWTVPMDAPKTLYYQCYTHRNLGWKINVENSQLKPPQTRNGGISLMTKEVLLLLSILLLANLIL